MAETKQQQSFTGWNVTFIKKEDIAKINDLPAFSAYVKRTENIYTNKLPGDSKQSLFKAILYNKDLGDKVAFVSSAKLTTGKLKTACESKGVQTGSASIRFFQSIEDSDMAKEAHAIYNGKAFDEGSPARSDLASTEGDEEEEPSEGPPNAEPTQAQKGKQPEGKPAGPSAGVAGASGGGGGAGKERIY